jgi:hypothetical protein
LNNGNWLPKNQAESLRDELFYQRAVHAYITMLPALYIRADWGKEAILDGSWQPPRIKVVS